MGFVDYSQSSGAVSGDLSNYYTKSQTNTLINTSVSQSDERTEIEDGFKNAFSSSYHERVKTDGRITQINIWADSGKLTKLFTKDLTWVNGLLMGVTVTDEQNGNYLNKGFTYLDGEWFATNKTFGG